MRWSNRPVTHVLNLWMGSSRVISMFQTFNPAQAPCWTLKIASHHFNSAHGRLPLDDRLAPREPAVPSVWSMRVLAGGNTCLLSDALRIFDGKYIHVCIYV